MSIRQYAAPLAVVFAGSASLADGLPPGVLSCLSIPTASIRLICFDREVATAKANANAASATPATTDTAVTTPDPEVALTAETPKGGNWTVDSTTSAMTDDANHFVSVASDSYVSCRQYGSSTQLTLMVRCMENTTALIIFGDCHLASGFGGYGDVTWRTDDDKAVTRSFEASTDSAALGIWSGGGSIPAIKELFGKESLVVRLTPFGMSPIEVTFDIEGLEDVIEPLREECEW